MRFAICSFLAGVDTVATMLGFIAQYLAKNPALFQELKADISKLPKAVDELVRMQAFINLNRICEEDIEFHGVKFRKGDNIVIPTYVSDHDARNFPNPSQYNTERSKQELNMHHAFGDGPHKCIGMHLAKLEIRIVLEEMMKRMDTLEIADPDRVTAHGGTTMGLDSCPFTSNHAPHSAMSNIAIVEKFYHAIATGQGDVIAALLDDAVELIVPGDDGVLHGHYRGKECFLTQIFPTVFSGVDPTQITFCKNIKIVNADGENVTALAQNDGIALTGKAYNQLYGHIFQLRKGKIIRLIEFYDGLLAQAALWQNTPHVQADAAFHIENIAGISQSNVALAQAFIAAWESNKSGRSLELMHEDCFYHNIPLPALEGKKQLAISSNLFLKRCKRLNGKCMKLAKTAMVLCSVSGQTNSKSMIIGYPSPSWAV